MKKRINTLMYDTETAKKLAEYRHNYDDAAYTEILYKKRTGEYFIYGKGDAGAYSSGEDIKPLTYRQAQRWFEKANNDDDSLATDEVYDREFGQIVKSDEVKEATSINLSRTAKRKLEQMALKQGTSQSKIVENLILSE